MRATQILVADPIQIFRAGVRTLLARESDFAVAESGCFEELLASIDGGCPDIALIDLDLPPYGGIAAIEKISARCSTYMIVWSFEPTRETVLEAICSGAHGFLRKEISPIGLIRALRGVSQGEAPLSRDLATLLIDALHTFDERSRARNRAAVLSIREREVLRLIVHGARNREIANELTISEFTVKRHVQNILHKLELPSRHAAASFYVRAYGSDEAPQATAQLA